jgi:hypothetical protein
MAHGRAPTSPVQGECPARAANWRTAMKTFVATVALAASIAMPALAQTVDRRAPAPQYYPSQYDQFGRREVIRPLNPYAVYDGYTYLGADPDPNVRLQLRLDAEHRDF